MALLEIDSVEAGYETGQVLFDLDLSVEEGEVVSLLGRNGAGKTTTLRTVVGVTPPKVLDGDIRYEGSSLAELRPYERARQGLSLVPEERRLWPNLTVEENIRVAMNHAADPKEMEAVLSYFPALKEMIDKKARNMSGGEQQMLAIARGLATNPRLILLDEPSEGLAPYVVRNVVEVIRDINQEEGITTLLVEQNVVMAMEVSDRHYIIDQGHIVEKTTPSALREDEQLREQYLSV